ncbi:MAG: TerC family protein [Verrucomicrobiota bacterium]|nr:TerC family protein [Verrucomicrobiota bacterium]
MESLLDVNLIATFFLLIGLELVLGVDNILIISIVTGRLPKEQQNKARIIGLALALGLRILMLFGAGLLIKMSHPVIGHLSIKDIVLLAGGLFLLYKAVKEIHHVVEFREEHTTVKAVDAFWSSITQIVVLDLVFSIDSVITAVGLTSHFGVIIGAVLISFILVIIFAGKVSQFITTYPTVKILALSFLLCIGTTLVMEGLHQHVPKGYIYLPMGFALAVELLQLRYDFNRKNKAAKGEGA